MKLIMDLIMQLDQDLNFEKSKDRFSNKAVLPVNEFGNNS